jgi:hypothetical protein
MNRISTMFVLLALPAALVAQQKQNPLNYAAKPTAAAITPADLMSRLYGFADDSMMGRNAGTVYHDKGVEYIGREVARLKLKPGGDNGTFFQRIPLMMRGLAQDTKFTVDGRDFVPGVDILPRDASVFGADSRELQGATAIYGGVFGDTAMIKPDLAAGKVVVITVPRGWQANRGALTQRYVMAAGLVVASLDSMPADMRKSLAEPAPSMVGAPRILQVPVFFFLDARDGRGNARCAALRHGARHHRQDRHGLTEVHRDSGAGIAQRDRDPSRQRSETGRSVRRDRCAQ